MKYDKNLAFALLYFCDLLLKSGSAELGSRVK